MKHDLVLYIYLESNEQSSDVMRYQAVWLSATRAQSRQTNLLLLELSLLLSATSLSLTTKASNRCSLSITTSLATEEQHCHAVI